MSSGPKPRALSTRAIGRAAVREELARVAFPRFCDEGFDAVTFDDLAAAAGVSRSTFLRYFGSKEEVVLFVFDPIGDAIVDSLGSRPAAEDDWTALRRSLAPAVAFVLRDPSEALTLLRLVRDVPTLCARLSEKQASWRPRLEQALLARAGLQPPPAVVLRARVAAALECLTVALQSWVENEGHDDLDALLDQAFGAFTLASVHLPPR